jgi:hypothetical protein
MLSPVEIEELNASIQTMDREELCYHLQHFRARFPLDFTPDFYAREPLPRLRHILFGLCLHNQQTLCVAVAA